MDFKVRPEQGEWAGHGENIPGRANCKSKNCEATVRLVCLRNVKKARVAVVQWLNREWASLVARMVKNLPAMQEFWVEKIPWRREWQPTPVFLPGELHGQTMGSKRIRHDWVIFTSLHTIKLKRQCRLDLVQFSSVQLLSRVRLFATP